MTDSVMGSWTYSYDGMNRLTNGTASACAGCVDAGLNLSWTYDRYGNRWAQNATGSGTASAVQPQLTFYGSGGVVTNRIDGWSYDAAGNLLNDQINTYTYDAENRIATLNGSPAYIYDAEGRRVAKTNASGAVTAVYILNLNGEQVSELSGSGAWVHSNVFAGKKMIATYAGPAGTVAQGYYYHLTDWLGTKRMQTNASGNNPELCYSYPFGDGLNCTGGQDATEHHFTGKERDTESGLDYFFARYLTSDLGRFLTPDWAAVPTAVPYAQYGNPQSLNIYAYVGNNPNTGIDFDGHLGGNNLDSIEGILDGGAYTPGYQSTPTPAASSTASTTPSSGSSNGSAGTPATPPAPAKPAAPNPTPPPAQAPTPAPAPTATPTTTTAPATTTATTPPPASKSPAPTNPWDWDETRPQWPKTPPGTYTQPYGQCFNIGWSQTSLPVVVQVGANVVSVAGIVVPNPVSLVTGAANTLYNFSRVVSIGLVCTIPGVNASN
jgi:RHS repeat-associated protein